MLLVYLGIYTLIMAVLWGLFIVAKIHAYKFKNFSTDIPKVTTFLAVILLILSVSGYILIFMGIGDSGIDLYDYSGNSNNGEINEINY